jgi:hypothetical protein
MINRITTRPNQIKFDIFGSGVVSSFEGRFRVSHKAHIGKPHPTAKYPNQ